METLWWWLAAMLMFFGLIGTVVPLIPGAALIFVGVVVHRWGLGPEQSVGWVTITAVFLLMVLSQVVDFLSGVAGAKYFGATRWGAIGGILGGLIGIFFGLPGLIIGPLIGVLLGELIGGQRLLSATRSTWGTLLGTGAGMVAKILIAFLMIGWFLAGLIW